MPQSFRFAALLLAAAAALAFVLQPLLPTQELVLVSSQVLERPHTLLTHIFLHGSPRHLIGNLFALALFGSVLERLVGWRRFLLVFILGGLASALGDILFYEATIGASGAVFGILGAVAAMRPRMPVPALGTILPMAAAAALWALLDLTGFLYPDGIAHAAHLSGLAAGLLIGLLWRGSFPEEPGNSGKPVREDEKEIREWEEKWMSYSRESLTHFR